MKTLWKRESAELRKLKEERKIGYNLLPLEDKRGRFDFLPDRKERNKK
ncbi:MAG: hypothetical protein LBD66_00220 [Holosporales bacterium]|jgi:hypothetical protein|nr:hypothetical protein [Holosporales bacterium]